MYHVQVHVQSSRLNLLFTTIHSSLGHIIVQWALLELEVYTSREYLQNTQKYNHYYYYYSMPPHSALHIIIYVRMEIVYAIKRFMSLCGCGYVYYCNETIERKNNSDSGGGSNKNEPKIYSEPHQRKMYNMCWRQWRVSRIECVVKRSKATIKRTHQASIERIETRITYVVCALRSMV